MVMVNDTLETAFKTLRHSSWWSKLFCFTQTKFSCVCSCTFFLIPSISYVDPWLSIISRHTSSVLTAGKLYFVRVLHVQSWKQESHRQPVAVWVISKLSCLWWFLCAERWRSSRFLKNLELCKQANLPGSVLNLALVLAF